MSEEESMNDDKIKGKVDDIKGRVKRQAGEWTGDESLQAEGTMDQVKGKTQNAWGKVKDGVKDAVEGDRRDDDVDRKNRDVA
jgi:uncharacterized protein YjbJ (UPF0337 family)